MSFTPIASYPTNHSILSTMRYEYRTVYGQELRSPIRPAFNGRHWELPRSAQASTIRAEFLNWRDSLMTYEEFLFQFGKPKLGRYARLPYPTHLAMSSTGTWEIFFEKPVLGIHDNHYGVIPKEAEGDTCYFEFEIESPYPVGLVELPNRLSYPLPIFW